MPDFLPRRHDEFFRFAKHFLLQLEGEGPFATGSARDVCEQHARRAEMAAAFAEFAEAHDAMESRDRRSPVMRARRSAARAALSAHVRNLTRHLRATAGIDAATLIALGLRPRREGKAPRLPTPADAPGITLRAATGRSVEVRFHDADSAGRAKARGTYAVRVSTWTGEDAPNDVERWPIHGHETRSIVRIEVGPEVPLGTTFWVTGQWMNPRGALGPPSTPLRVIIGGGTGFEGMATGRTTIAAA